MYISVAEHEKHKRIHNGIGLAHLHETWTGPGRYLDLSSSGPTSYRFHEVPCERKAYLDPVWDRSQIYSVPCKRGLKGLLCFRAKYRNIFLAAYPPYLRPAVSLLVHLWTFPLKEVLLNFLP